MAFRVLGVRMGGVRLTAFAMLSAGALACLFFVDPANSSIYPRCPVFVLTGWFCPGCGSLRAMHQLLHGNIAVAAQYNALLVASVPGLPLLHTVKRLRVSPLVGRAVLGTVLAFALMRNVPAWPFTTWHP
jgi:hypothetical protein